MKNKLLSTLLAFTTILSLAQQPSNAELITHLKNVRSEIQTNLEEIPTEESLKNDWGTENFFFLLNLFNEIKTIDQTFSTQGIDTEELYLTELCKVKSLSEITQAFNDAQLAFMLHEEVYNQERAEKKLAEMTAIFTKHHQAYCLQYPNGNLRNLTFDEMSNPEYQLANFAQDGRELFQKLLSKVNTKIALLEAQT